MSEIILSVIQAAPRESLQTVYKYSGNPSKCFLRFDISGQCSTGQDPSEKGGISTNKYHR